MVVVGSPLGLAIVGLRWVVGTDSVFVGVIDAIRADNWAGGSGVIDDLPDRMPQAFSVLLRAGDTEIAGSPEREQIFLEVGFADVGTRDDFRRPEHFEDPDGVPRPLPRHGDTMAFGEAASKPGHGFTAPPRRVWCPICPD